MIGETFGDLTVLFENGRSKDGQKKYSCKCVCGTEKTFISGNLKKGNSTNCGCKRRAKCAIRMKTLNVKHGKTNTKIWKTWKGIVERTTKKYSPHFIRYGGNGIGIHKEWLNFEAFAKYIGEPPSNKHSIDRLDNKKGYIPGNVRWATMKEQAHNRNTNVWVLLNQNVTLLSEAAKILGISKSSASRWVKKGKLTKVNDKESLCTETKSF